MKVTRHSRAAILSAASQFVDGYLDALRAMQPQEIGGTPCFGYGRGGIAYTLLKAGKLRSDRALVQSAERWAASAIRSGHRFHMRGWPRASFSRGLTGLHAIHALAAHAAGHDTVYRRELQRFLDGSRRARGSIELFQGMAGRLAGATVVMRSAPHPEVRTLGDQLAERVVGELEGSAVRLPATGMAHGYPGVVLGVLAWQAISKSLPKEALRRAVIAARTYKPIWPYPRRVVDWAHGHAGMAMLFARAYLELGDRRFLAWARISARAAALPLRGGGLMDGPTGIAYALLAVAAIDPGGPWRDEALMIAGRCLAEVDIPDRYPYGVWVGLGGLCCLALDLLHNTEAWFPGVEA